VAKLPLGYPTTKPLALSRSAAASKPNQDMLNYQPVLWLVAGTIPNRH
jgi:hypothetical protein